MPHYHDHDFPIHGYAIEPDGYMLLKQTDLTYEEDNNGIYRAGCHRAVYSEGRLFNIHCHDLGSVFVEHGVHCHMYADDAQLYVEVPRDQPERATDSLSCVIKDVKEWMTLNKLTDATRVQYVCTLWEWRM